jgi:predicted dienelactone hydrolase
MRRVALSFVALLFLLVAADAQAGRPRYADPRELGPHTVGHRLYELTDAARDDRHLRTEVWYPATPDAAEVASPTFYDFQFFGLGLTSPVALDDAPVANELGFPLIVFSHGSGGVSFQSTPLMEMLASHGFVVISPNHTGNTTNDVLGGTSTPFYVTAENRPRDVSFLIDWMLARNLDPEDEFYLKVNPDRIGVTGHSFGGFTALVAASGYHVPSRGIAVEADPRVKAIAPIAPASDLISDADLLTIDVPVMLLSATLDDTTPIETDTTRPWALLTTRPFYRVDIIDAQHLAFANACDIADALLEFGVREADVAFLVPGYYETCGPAALPIEIPRRLTNLYVTAFFKKHLLHDDRYDAFLQPEYAEANEPGIFYFRKDAGE